MRRVDNMITRLYDSARLLRMHATVLAAVRKEYVTEAAKAWGMVATGALSAGGLAGTLVFMGAWQVGAPLAAVTLFGTAGGAWFTQRQLAARAEYYLDGPGLDEAFRRVYYLQLAERDEFVLQLWERVRPQLATALRTLGIRGAPAAKRSELAALDAIVEAEVPALRRKATKAGAFIVETAAKQAAATLVGAGAPAGASAPAAAAVNKAAAAGTAGGGDAAKGVGAPVSAGQAVRPGGQPAGGKGA
jgi:hypothetical protein